MAEWLTPRRHTAMLCAIVAFVAVRALISDTAIAEVLFSVAVVSLMMTALYAIRIDELVGEQAALRAERRRNGLLGGTLAIIAIGGRLAAAYSSSSSAALLWELSWMLFIGFVTWNELRAVLRQKEITAESISMAISVYLLLGMTWSIIYDVIYQFQPQAFSLNGTASSLVPRGHPVFPILAYFSFITLTTVGYGDISPVTLQARYAAWIEGVTGQFYIAILVARLVSMQLVRVSNVHSSDTSPSSATSTGHENP